MPAAVLKPVYHQVAYNKADVDPSWAWAREGLLSGYALAEGTGDKVYDLAGIEPGTINSNTGWVRSSSGPALQGSGSSTGVSGCGDFLTANQPDISFVVYFRHTGWGTNWECICAQGQGGGNWSIQRAAGNNWLEFKLNGATSSIFGSTQIDDGKWHCIVGTQAGSVQTLYVDGVVDATGSASPGGGQNPGPYFLGYNNTHTSRYTRGEIAAFYMYDRALTVGEIMKLGRDPFGPARKRSRVPVFRAPTAGPAGADFPFRTYYQGVGVL